jgi:hypothetical protein
MKRYALISGVAYLLIFATGFYANFTVLETLMVAGDSLKTAQNLFDQHTLFKDGLIAFCLMLFFDVVLVFSLFPITSSFNRRWSLIASALRLVHAIGFGIALYSLFRAFSMSKLNPTGTSDGWVAAIQVSFENFDFVWTIALVVFGFHLFVLGLLFINYKSFPRFIGFFLISAAMGYVIDGSAKLLLPTYDENKHIFESIVIFTGIFGEFTLTIWLLVKGLMAYKEKVS